MIKRSKLIQQVRTKLREAHSQERYLNDKYEVDEASRRRMLNSKLYYLRQKISKYEKQLDCILDNLKASETPSNKEK